MTDAKKALFEKTQRIRFAHCDPAGIVYFPQYLVLLNGLVEDWFTDYLNISYAHLIGERRVGLPIVRLEGEFLAISRMGDETVLSLEVEKLGRTSMALRLGCSSQGQIRVQTRQVLVTTDLNTHRAIPIPSDVQDAIARFQAGL
jgi:4-hydroxybenzoyl-CoA thioesterase